MYKKNVPRTFQYNKNPHGRHCVCLSLREGVKKNFKLRTSPRGGGGKPPAVTKIVFLREKEAECSEMEKYAKIFLCHFARVSVKNFSDIFIKYWNFF